jgi:RimJ/RimL family protein N-acetyltransferase
MPNIIIRQANYNDLGWLTEVAAQNMFKEELKRPELYNYEGYYLFLENIMYHQRGVVFVAEKDDKLIGGIAGLVSSHPYNFNRTLLSESFWYVLPEYRNTSAGAKLIIAFTEWGKDNPNVDEITMSLLPSSPDLFTSLEKKGYKLTEYVLNYNKKEGIE